MNLVEKESLHRKEDSESDIARHIKDNLSKRVRTNRLQGGKVICEDSPGNFTIEKKGDVLVIRVYNVIGQALEYEYPQAKAEIIK